MPTESGIWLEVSNVRKEGDITRVQLKGDKTDREAQWWEVKGDDPYGEISRGLDMKRIVLARLQAKPGKKLFVDLYRIQFSNSVVY